MDISNILKLELRTNFKQHLFTTTQFNYEEKNKQFSIMDTLVNDLLSENQTINLITNSADGTRIMYRAFVTKILGSEALIRILDEGNSVEERRKYIKVSTNITGNLLSVERNGLPLKFPSPIPTIIIDINQGGILINNTHPLTPGSRITIDIPLGENSYLVKCEVLRAQNSANRISGYGCQFIGLSAEAEKAINDWIFAEVGNKY